MDFASPWLMASETHVTTEPLTPGIKMIENVDGARNGHLDHPEVMFSLDGKPHENEGRVIGAASVGAETTPSAW